jgi:hypothetical protein
MTGPDYIQQRQYKEWNQGGDIHYTVNFRMKIDGTLSQGVPVCTISVTYRAEDGQLATLISQTLYANQLSNSFSNYSLNYTIPEFTLQQNQYSGSYGVQFNVRWLGDGSLSGSRNLYVDYIEVYDNLIWSNYLSNPSSVTTQIINYAATAGTNNTKYWYSLDEPESIDNYQPYKTVNNILTNNGYPPLITAFSQGWTSEKNNESDMKEFLERAQPNKIMYDYYPYSYINPSTDEVKSKNSCKIEKGLSCQIIR